MDRVAEIIEHLKLADGDEVTVSMHRWEASRLIWEEIEAGKSRRGLGQEIGKSHTHVRYMYNCWDLVGRKIEGDLPSFQEIYMSSEVRGGEDDNSQDNHRDRRNRREPSDEDDVSAHGLTLRAANALDTLNRNEAFWPLLTDDDVTVLREAEASLTSILAGIGRLSARPRLPCPTYLNPHLTRLPRTRTVRALRLLAVSCLDESRNKRYPTYNCSRHDPKHPTAPGRA